MDFSILTENQRELLSKLGSSGFVHPLYLAGVTGLALHLGHRLSEDFGFFSEASFEPESLQHQAIHQFEAKPILVARQTLVLRCAYLLLLFLFDAILQITQQMCGVSLALLQAWSRRARIARHNGLH